MARGGVPVWLGLALFGLALFAGISPSHAQPASAATPSAPNQAILRRLMAEGAMDRPLLPQPGDIWAGAVAGTPDAAPPPPQQSAPRRIAAGAGGAPAPSRAPAVTGGVAVQLAAANNAQAAMAAWHRLRERARGLTDGHDPAIVQVEVKGRPVWRLRTSGFADAVAAGTFCARVRAAGGRCFVVPASER